MEALCEAPRIDRAPVTSSDLRPTVAAVFLFGFREVGRREGPGSCILSRHHGRGILNNQTGQNGPGLQLYGWVFWDVSFGIIEKAWFEWNC